MAEKNIDMSKKGIDVSEKEAILAAMAQMAEGKFTGVDAESFEDKEFAENFNEYVLKAAKHNNNYLMRVNEAMGQIGNIDWIKKVFGIIGEQDTLLGNFHEHQDVLNAAADSTDEYGVQVLALTRQIESNLTPCIQNIDDNIKAVKEAEKNGNFSESTAKKIITQMQFNKSSIETMLDAARETVITVKSIYDANVAKNEEMKPLIAGVNKLADSCNALSTQCFNAGLTMYNISRVVDNVRNDMYRHNSLLEIHDCLKIYMIDHLVLTWRIFNHIQEYETLVINQLNNPDRCKFGLWCSGAAPDWLRETESFKAAYDAHRELHNHAVAAFEAKESANNVLAMEEFERTLTAFGKFKDAIDSIHAELKKSGITEETELLVGV